MDDDTRSALQALEESLWRAETRFDDAVMERLLAPDFVEFGRSGRIYARNDMFPATGQAEIRATLPLPGFHARYLAPDVVQLTYISEVRYETGMERANRSSIWTRSDGIWQLRFHQGTPRAQSDDPS